MGVGVTDFTLENRGVGRGKNGRFEVNEIRVCDLDINEEGEPDIFLEVYSKKRGYQAPITLRLSPNDAWRLGQALQKVSVGKVVLTKTDKPL